MYSPVSWLFLNRMLMVLWKFFSVTWMWAFYNSTSGDLICSRCDHHWIPPSWDSPIIGLPHHGIAPSWDSPVMGFLCHWIPLRDWNNWKGKNKFVEQSRKCYTVLFQLQETNTHLKHWNKCVCFVYVFPQSWITQIHTENKTSMHQEWMPMMISFCFNQNCDERQLQKFLLLQQPDVTPEKSTNLWNVFCLNVNTSEQTDCTLDSTSDWLRMVQQGPLGTVQRFPMQQLTTKYFLMALLCFK